MSKTNFLHENSPVYKLQNTGVKSLSNVELFNLLGVPVETAKKLLAENENNLHKIQKMSFDELLNFDGIGTSTAKKIIGGLEIWKRAEMQKGKPKNNYITSSINAFRIFSPLFYGLDHERFYCMYLNRRNQVIRTILISQGGIHSTVVDMKIIFKHAFTLGATGIIAAHNHPSGKNEPGQSDINLTKRLKEACILLEIDLLDHLVITDFDFFSFLDEGLL